MKPLDLRAFFARRALHEVSAEDLVGWAVEMLGAGQDTPSLRILAGLDLERPLDSEEVERYFQKALIELGVPEPDPGEALLRYARLLVVETLEGRRDPRATLARMTDLALETRDERLAVWRDLGDCVSEDEIEAAVLREAGLLREFGDLEWPEGLGSWFTCADCGLTGQPREKRSPWLILPIYIAWRLPVRKPLIEQVCAGCGSPRLEWTGSHQGRKRYLRELRARKAEAAGHSEGD